LAADENAAADEALNLCGKTARAIVSNYTATSIIAFAGDGQARSRLRGTAASVRPGHPQTSEDPGTHRGSEEPRWPVRCPPFQRRLEQRPDRAPDAGRATRQTHQ